MVTNEHVFKTGERVVMKPSHPTHGDERGVVVDTKLVVSTARSDGHPRFVRKVTVGLNDDTTISCNSCNFRRVTDIPLNEQRKTEKDRSVTYQKKNCKQWNEPTPKSVVSPSGPPPYASQGPKITPNLKITKKF